jgi:multidrug efflux system outer membrane protein
MSMVAPLLHTTHSAQRTGPMLGMTASRSADFPAVCSVQCAVRFILGLAMLSAAGPTVGQTAPPAAAPSAPSVSGSIALPRPDFLKAAPTRTIGLDEVLRLARTQNPTVGIAEQRVREARANRSLAQAQLLPDLNVAAGLARLLPNIATVAGVPTGRAKLYLAPGKLLYDLRASREDLKAATAGQQTATADALTLGAEEYYELVRAEAFVQIAEQAVARSQELVRVSQELENGGAGLKSDTLRSQAQLAADRQFLLRSQEAYREAAVSLATTLLLPPEPLLVPGLERAQPETLVQETDTEMLIRRALSARPEVREAKAAVAADRAREKGALWSALVPALGVEQWFGGVSNHPADDRRTWYFAEWKLFDELGQSAAARKQAAAAQRRSDELRADQLRAEITAGVVQAAGATRVARAQIETAQEGVIAARAALELSQVRLQGGVGLALEVLQAQDALTRAEVNLVDAIVEYNRAQVELRSRIGDPVGAPMPGAPSAVASPR